MISSNKTLSLLIAIGALSLSSCSKDENTSTDNCADRFVGTYAVSVIEQVVWGNDSGTLTDTGTLIISKISDEQVQAKGFFNCVVEIAN